MAPTVHPWAARAPWRGLLAALVFGGLLFGCGQEREPIGHPTAEEAPVPPIAPAEPATTGDEPEAAGGEEPESPAEPAGEGASEGDAPRGCAAIEAEYDRLVEAASTGTCTADADCQVLRGHCAHGIGGCAYVGDRSVSQARLDALAEAFRSGSCGGGACRCARPPGSARCEAGSCVGAP